MEIEIKILKILKESKDFNNEGLQVQNLDKLLGRKGEREFLGANLVLKLDELAKEELIEGSLNRYKILEKGLVYLEENQEN